MSDTIDNTDVSDQAAIGKALERARLRVGLSTVDAASRLGLSDRHLAYLEAGIKTPADDLMLDMAKLYGVEITAFGQRAEAMRRSPRIDEELGRLWIGWTPVAIRGAGNERLISDLAAAIRENRGLAPQHPVYLREREVPLIASLVDLDDDEVGALLAKHFHIALDEANALVEEMISGLSDR